MSDPTPDAGNLDQLPRDEPFPGVSRRRLDSPRATVTFYEFDPGASFPLHKHSQEQITLIERGEVDLTVAENTRRMRADDWSWVPPNVNHGLIAGPQGARLLAIVVPRRPDTDAYSVVE
jgi:quercetin dioxygenase-like cupin family protein